MTFESYQTNRIFTIHCPSDWHKVALWLNSQYFENVKPGCKFILTYHMFLSYKTCESVLVCLNQTQNIRPILMRNFHIKSFKWWTVDSDKLIRLQLSKSKTLPRYSQGLVIEIKFALASFILLGNFNWKPIVIFTESEHMPLANTMSFKS